MAVPYTFATATTSIPLSQLDSNFATPITLGNTAIQLGNTVTTLNNMTMANVTISSVASTFPNNYLANSTATLGNATITLGGTTSTVGNLTLTNATISSGTYSVTNATVSGSLTLSGGTANGVAYLNGSNVLTTGSALTFDGSSSLVVSTSSSNGVIAVVGPSSGTSNGAQFQIINGASVTSAIGTYSRVIGGAYNESLAFLNNGNDFVWYSGSERMRLTSTGLGIGTSSPARKLDVNGDALIYGLTVGRGAGAVSTNTAVGASALAANTTGASNAAFGYEALYANTTGNFNVAFGRDSLDTNTTGSNNTAIGYSALQANTTASNNTAVGYQAGYSNTTGANNVVIGDQALYTNTVGGTNTAVGRQAGYSTTGGFNTFIGNGAGYDVTSGTKNTILGRYSGNAGGLDIRTANNYIVLSDGDGNPRQIIDGSGNLGLGVTPSAWNSSYKALQVGPSASMWSTGTGGARWGVNYYLNASDSLTYISSNFATDYRQSNGAHSWHTAPSGTAGNAISFTQAMTLDASGNLGVGTTSPTNNSNKTTLTLNNATWGGRYEVAVNGTVKGTIDWGTSDTFNLAAVGASVPMTFLTNGSERARIDSSGNLCVGITTATNLVTAGPVANVGGLFGSASTAGYPGVQGAHTSNSATGYVAYFSNSGSGTGLYISNTAAWQSTSDVRLKTDIQDLNTTARLMQLRPRDYLWKSQETSDNPTKRNFGFIAQEVQQVFPELVGESPDGMLSVEYTGLIAPLVKAIQELKAEVDSLKTQLKGA